MCSFISRDRLTSYNQEGGSDELTRWKGESIQEEKPVLEAAEHSLHVAHAQDLRTSWEVPFTLLENRLFERKHGNHFPTPVASNPIVIKHSLDKFYYKKKSLNA